ncbi:MAG: chloride channel protein [Candidatus Geothermarchaeales archaeon]
MQQETGLYSAWVRVVVLSVIAGVAGGLGAVVFRYAIDLVSTVFQEGVLNAVSYEVGGLNVGIALLPLVGGLIVGVVVFTFAPETKGHGVPEVMEAVHLKAGEVRSRVAVVKILASAVTIGSGGSAGREGPIAQIGSSVGSILGRVSALPREARRTLVISGLAAGIGGTFNAPLGGALFALEVVYPSTRKLHVIPVFLASIVGTAVAQEFLGVRPAFSVPAFTIANPMELVLFLPLGLAFGLLAALWVSFFYKVEDLFDALPLNPRVKPAIGGFLTGLIGLHFLGSGLMGVGYEGIEGAVAGEITLAFLLVLGALKMLTTSLTIGSGGSGGIFAPSLFIGVMFGTVFGVVYNQLVPGLSEQPFVYGLAGMGALFAASAKAPITSIVIVSEMFDNSHLLPPLMISVAASYVVSSYFLRGSSIYTLKLERRGIKITKIEVLLGLVSVEEVMTPARRIVHVSPETPASQMEELMWEHHHMGYPVLEDGRLVGMVTFHDLREIPEEMQDETAVGEVSSKDVVVTYPDDTAWDALHEMNQAGVGRLPVVRRDRPDELLGIISRSDIMKAHEMAESYATSV